MSIFTSELPKRSPLLTFSPLNVSRLQPSLLPTPVSTPGSPVAQRGSETGTRPGYSFEQMSLFPPAKENHTGLPDRLKAGMENLSGMSLDDVSVHYGSSRPTAIQARAYTQGTSIYVGPGQEKHLAHEAWHVVQQKQGRVEQTNYVRGRAINDDSLLESEADKYGAMVARQPVTGEGKESDVSISNKTLARQKTGGIDGPIQMVKAKEIEEEKSTYNPIDQQSYSSKVHLGKSDTATGFGATDEATGKPLKTSIQWSSVDAQGEEGKQVVALQLGPDHPLGSPPQGKKGDRDIWIRRRDAFLDTYKGPFVIGHLLNAELGGPGSDKRNLTCISGSANAKMLTDLEGEIVRAVNTEHKWIHYSASVTYTKLDKFANNSIYGDKFKYFASQIDFKWGPIDSDGSPTGKGKTWRLAIPQPVIKESDDKASMVDKMHTGPVETDTGNKNAQASTKFEYDDIVLDEWQKVRKQIETIKRDSTLLAEIDELRNKIAIEAADKQEKDRLLKEQEGLLEAQKKLIENLRAELEATKKELSDERARVTVDPVQNMLVLTAIPTIENSLEVIAEGNKKRKQNSEESVPQEEVATAMELSGVNQ